MIVRADSRPDRWALIWGALTSDRLLLIWLGLLTLATVASLLIPQAPRSAYQQDGGIEDWLTSVRPQVGRPADTLVALGLLTISHSAWLRLIAAGTAATLVLRLWDAAQLLRGRFDPYHPRVTRRVTVSGDQSSALDYVREELDQTMTYHVERGPGWRLMAKRPLGHLGNLLLVAGGLVVIGGWGWTQFAGWELSELRVTEDISAAIVPAAQILELKELQVVWADADRPTSASGRFVTQDGDDGEGRILDLDETATWDSTRFRFDAVGPAVRIRGEHSDGAALRLQTAASQPPVGQLTLPLPPDGGSRSFAAPFEGVVVQLETETLDGPPRVRMRTYQGREGELMDDLVISDQAAIDLNGAHLDLEVVPYAEITASRSPGAPLGVLGAVLILGGIITWIVYPAHQLHVVAAERGQQTELVLAVSTRRDTRWLEGLVDRLEPHRTDESDDG